MRRPASVLLDPVTFAASLERAPLDEEARRAALFGKGAWVILQFEGKPVVLAGMVACRFGQDRSGYLALDTTAKAGLSKPGTIAAASSGTGPASKAAGYRAFSNSLRVRAWWHCTQS